MTHTWSCLLCHLHSELRVCTGHGSPACLAGRHPVSSRFLTCRDTLHPRAFIASHPVAFSSESRDEGLSILAGPGLKMGIFGWTGKF